MMNKKRKNEFIERKKNNIIANKTITYNIFKTILFNRFFFAIASGITIGIIFGLISLHFLTESGQSLSSSSDHLSVSTPASNESINSVKKESITIQGLYVIQLGLFQEEKNASMSQQNFKKQQIETVVWARNNEHFVFHSIYLTEQKAKEKVLQLAEKDIDSFVKPWSVTIDFTNINDEEYEPIKAFVSLWEKSIEQIDSGYEIQLNDWHSWLENVPDSPFIEHIETLFEQKSSLDQRFMLLEMINKLEQYTST